MFKFLVLSALLAVAVADPSQFIAPVASAAYSTPYVASTYAHAPVVSAYSAPHYGHALWKRSLYTAPVVHQSRAFVSSPAYAHTPLAYSAPLTSHYGHGIWKRSVYAAPLAHTVSSYSSPLVSAYSRPLVSAYSTPVLSSYGW